MSIPVWIGLAFAGWTLLVLVGTVGVYRWSQIFSGRSRVADWKADEPQGSEWYRRAVRAHMNCVENLPVYGSVALAAVATGVHSQFLDAFAIAFMVARICQTSVHIALKQTETVASLRFGLFLVQIVCAVAMGISIGFEAKAG